MIWSRILLAAALLCGLCAYSAEAQAVAEDPGVRELIKQWNTAYRAMNAKALAELHTDDVEVIDRFGHWVKSQGQQYTAQLWSMTFKEIYKGKPGPERKVEAVRMLTPDVAQVRATTQWDAVTLEDGTRIPPHGEIDTFTLVKRDGTWRIAALNIHNQMQPGTERPGERVPVPVKKP